MIPTRVGVLVAALVALVRAAPAATINDVTRLNPIAVERVVRPRTIAEVQQLVRAHPGPIAIAGGRYSMGGQIGTDGALVIDMRDLDHVVALDPTARVVTVETGITWRKLQEAIDPHDLSVKIMQSYASFTVGGALSVNAHGRYVNLGPVIHSVREIGVVLADGSLVTASPTTRPEVFYGAIGGYGALGPIVTATLDLAPNVRLERHAVELPLAEYPAWFQREIRHSPTAVLHNGDLYPPHYDRVRAITYDETERPVTVKDRLRPWTGSHWGTRFMQWLVADVPLGKTFREQVLDPVRFLGAPVVWRNYEASYDVAELEPHSREKSTYVLEEYFVPEARLAEFVPVMGEIFTRHKANVINVSIRHAISDPGAYLAWAPQDSFALVVYYKQGTTPAARAEVGVWTRELIDAVLAVGGRYYLPYQLHATDAQFHKAYPRARELFALKQRLDPGYKFRNRLWDRYFPPPDRTDGAAVAAQLASRAGYRRAEDQTFLTLPEWYIVFSADEYAAFLDHHLPSDFPWFGSIGQFWGVCRSVRRATRDDYPTNWGYQAMIGVIGASFTTEYALKGVWEKSVGRLTEWVSLGRDPGARAGDDLAMNDVARDYARFIHATPWYDFPFGARLGRLWSYGGPWTVRQAERRFVSTAELAGKTVWAHAIKAATGAAYAPEDAEVLAWVRGGPADLAAVYPGVRVVEPLPDGRLVAIPRYEPFGPALTALAVAEVRFVEIAGNHRIAMTLIAPREWDGARLLGDVVREWPVLTADGRKRVALAVPVARLTETLPALGAEGVVLDHVYDY